ncbi:ribonuclease HII [bacterium]|nr:MAG: ribonuclease HII [bacterium]
MSLKKEEKDRFIFERQLWSEGYSRVMGLDEVGRGCLAGPVVAAGVILPVGYHHPLLKDSKQLTEAQRLEMAEIIKQDAVSYVIKEGSIELIDEKNILWASLLTMEVCVNETEPSPDYLLIDGNRYVPTLYPHQCLVKGDDRSGSIAAASILAKVYRDDLMIRLHEEFPEYNWMSNVGYPTKDHFKGLEEFGITAYHRKSFKLRTSKIRK